MPGQSRQLGGLALGRHPRLGDRWRLGHCEQSELLQDALKHTEQVIFWSVYLNSTSYMYSGQETSSGASG